MLLAKKLKKERIDRGILQGELSKLAGFSAAYLYKIESGYRSNPELNTLRRLVDAMNSFNRGTITVSDLIRDTEYDSEFAEAKLKKAKS